MENEWRVRVTVCEWTGVCASVSVQASESTVRDVTAKMTRKTTGVSRRSLGVEGSDVLKVHHASWDARSF